MPDISSDYELVKNCTIEELYEFILKEQEMAEKTKNITWQFMVVRTQLEISEAIHLFAEGKRRCRE